MPELAEAVGQQGWWQKACGSWSLGEEGPAAGQPRLWGKEPRDSRGPRKGELWTFFSQRVEEQ